MVPALKNFFILRLGCNKGKILIILKEGEIIYKQNYGKNIFRTEK